MQHALHPSFTQAARRRTPRRGPDRGLAPSVRRPLGRGFTMVELIAVLILMAILSAVAVPRMGPFLSLPGAAWRDQLLAGLGQARSLAQGHRRLVCVTLASGELRLSMAATNPATSCNTVLPGPDGDARWARDSRGLALSVLPAGTLYAQPNGRFTSDGAGQLPVNVSITVAGESAIVVTGETGHVR